MGSATPATPKPAPEPGAVDGSSTELDFERKPSATSGASAVRWSAYAVIGRQASQMLAALILARILGPQAYGVISAATVYVTFTTLLLDQGLATALVQRPTLTRRLPGAVASANIVCGLILAGVTVAVAPAVSAFFHAPPLTPLLQILGVGLLLKAVAITPRAINLRLLRFKLIGIADIGGGVAGAAAGICAALLGAGIWSMAVQVGVTDLVIAIVLIAKTRGVRPNRHLGELREILPFSLRIFGSNGLAFFSRNLDNVLVGRVLGVTSLSLYSMAYRVLVIPVQMIGQTVNRVSFPMFSRLLDEPDRLRRAVLQVIELLSFAAVPAMLLASVAAPELVEVVLGPQWAATAPILTVLAVAGARETVLSVTQSLMRAQGAGKLILRYEFLATGLQLTGIVVGLQFGLLGVALGLTAAGFLLTPVLLFIQRRLADVAIRVLLRRMLPPVHAAVWGIAAYLGVRWLGTARLGLSDLSILALGSLAYLAGSAIVLWVVHRAALQRAVNAAVEIFAPPRKSRRQPPRR